MRGACADVRAMYNRTIVHSVIWFDLIRFDSI